MNPPGFRFAFLLAAAALLGGCASTDPAGSGQAGMTSSAGKSGGAGKADYAREKTGKSADKETAPSPENVVAKAAPKADYRCPPNKKVAGTSSKTTPKRVGAAENDGRPAATKKPAEEILSPEAALAKAVAEEKAYDQELRRRFGVSEDAKLGDLLSPEETKEAVRLHARTEAARRRLALTLKSAPPASPATAAKPLKGIDGDGQAMAAAAPTTASLPAIPDASAPAAAKTPTALHLSDWLLDDKTHQAWREKHLSKLSESKDGPPTEPEKK